MTSDNYDEPAMVYVLRWPKAGRYYIGNTIGSLAQRVGKHKDNGTKIMKSTFREYGDPERVIYRQGIPLDEARAVEAELIHKVRAVIGDALINE